MTEQQQVSPISGRIVRGIGGFYTVALDHPTEEQTVTAKPIGIFRHQKITPTIGDRVTVTKDLAEDELYAITEIAPRKNHFVRPPVANVDVAFVTFALKKPRPNGLLIDKMLIACEVRGVTPVLCFTKADLAKQKDRAILDIYAKTPYTVLASDGTQIAQTAAKIQEIIDGRTAFFAGPSGVGKSTLTNALCHRDAMDTGELSEKLGRGKHTTRHVELLALPGGGYLFDTPGFSSLKLDEAVDEVMLREAFAEFPEGVCRFADCRHVKEPGCAVREKVEAGDIASERYDHYLAMLDEIDHRKLY